MSFSLRIIEPGCERRIDLRHTMVVGRDPSCELPLDDPLVSRRHLRLRLDAGGRLWAEELGSRNGASRNGVRIRGPAALTPGDRLELGRSILVVEAAEGVDEASSPSAAESSKSEGASAWMRRESNRPEAASVAGAFLGQALRRGPILLAVSGLLLLLFLAWSFGAREGGAPAGAVWPLQEETAALVFGWGAEAEIASPASLHFDWLPALDPRTHLTSLRYESLHEAGAEGIELRLNGVPIGTLGGSGLGWTEASLPLPRELIRPGEPNRISFVHLPNERGARQAWLLSGIQISAEALPSCERNRCLQEAEDRLEEGELFFARRWIEARKLLHARRAFRQALLYLEGLDPKPDLYGVTLERLQETEALLGKRCRDMRFRVVRYIAFGEEAAAAEEAGRMARFFSEEDHPCHRSARRFLELLE